MKRKKRALTLLEIIIVIFLITLITGAIGYNMKGALDRGRAFRTEQAILQLHDLLLLCLAENNKKTPEEIAAKPIEALKAAELAKDPEKLLQDGWGHPFVITLNRTKTDFNIRSEALKKYYEKIKKPLPEEQEEDS